LTLGERKGFLGGEGEDAGWPRGNEDRNRRGGACSSTVLEGGNNPCRFINRIERAIPKGP